MMIHNQKSDNTHNPRDSIKSRLSRSRFSENSQPVKLLAYHQERSSSKNKQFYNNMASYSGIKQNNSAIVRDLHKNLEKLINNMIEKLEEKKKNLLNSWSQDELQQAEKQIIGWSDSLFKQSKPGQSISSIVNSKSNTNTQNGSFISAGQLVRGRGTTSPAMTLTLKHYESQLQKSGINEALKNKLNPQKLSEKLSLSQNSDVKTTSSVQLQTYFPQDNSRKPLTKIYMRSIDGEQTTNRPKQNK